MNETQTALRWLRRLATFDGIDTVLLFFGLPTAYAAGGVPGLFLAGLLFGGQMVVRKTPLLPRTLRAMDWSLRVLRGDTRLLRDLPEIWAKADKADRRDLVRLMFKDVRVDVPNSRVVSFTPLPVFAPVFRQVDILHELRPGVFAAHWWNDHFERSGNRAFLYHKVLPSDPEKTIQIEGLPFAIPDPFALSPRIRIAPGLSKALGMVRESGVQPEVVTQIYTGAVTPMPADLRKWPGAKHQAFIQDADLDVLPLTHVLATRYALLQMALCPDLADPLGRAGEFYGSLLSRGVWYVQDILPAENWQLFSKCSSNEGGPSSRLTLRRLLGELNRLGAEVTMKRNIFRYETSVVSPKANEKAAISEIIGTELWIKKEYG